MVIPYDADVYDELHTLPITPSSKAIGIAGILKTIGNVLPRLHAIVIGPGLGTTMLVCHTLIAYRTLILIHVYADL